LGEESFSLDDYFTDSWSTASAGICLADFASTTFTCGGGTYTEEASWEVSCSDGQVFGAPCGMDGDLGGGITCPSGQAYGPGGCYEKIVWSLHTGNPADGHRIMCYKE
jgi:hypothetical protein